VKLETAHSPDRFAADGGWSGLARRPGSSALTNIREEACRRVDRPTFPLSHCRYRWLGLIRYKNGRARQSIARHGGEPTGATSPAVARAPRLSPARDGADRQA